MKAYELIDQPEKWTKGQYARSKSGKPVECNSKSAKSFCAIGAMCKAYDEPIYKRASDKLWKALNHKSITEWNDSSEWKTVYETLKKLDI